MLEQDISSQPEGTSELSELEFPIDDVTLRRQAYQRGELSCWSLLEPDKSVSLTTLVRIVNQERQSLGQPPLPTDSEGIRQLYEENKSDLFPIIEVPYTNNPESPKYGRYYYRILLEEAQLVLEALGQMGFQRRPQLKVEFQPSSNSEIILLRQKFQEGVLPHRRLYHRETSVSLTNLFKMANAERRQQGLPLLPTGGPQLRVCYLAWQEQLPQVIRVPGPGPRKGQSQLFAYRVLTEEASEVIKFLTRIEIDRQLNLERSPEEATRYCQEQFYPCLAVLFDDRLPGRDEVYQLVDSWARRYFATRLPGEEEDLAQELTTKLRFYIEGTRGTFTSAAKFRNFVFKCCQYYFYNQARKIWGRREVEFSEKYDRSVEDQGGRGIVPREVSISLKDALTKLTAEQQAAMKLHLRGRSISEIAEILTRSEGRTVTARAVDLRLYHARTALRLIVQSEETSSPDLSPISIRPELGRLPLRQAQALELLLQAKSYREIASILTSHEGRIVTLSAVANLLRKAREKLGRE